MNVAIALKFISLWVFTFNSIECKPLKSDDPKIEANEFEINGDGTYYFKVATSDGFFHQAQGELEDDGSEEGSLVVEGRYSYTGPDGKLYEVVYIADKDGFHPSGEHLPHPQPGLPTTTPSPPTFRPPVEYLPPDCTASISGCGLG